MQYYADRIDDLYYKINYLYENKELKEFPFRDKCLEKYKEKINGKYQFNWCLLTSKEAMELSNFFSEKIFNNFF